MANSHSQPIIVITAARAAYCHLAPLTPYVLPELKASQPHHKTNKPIHALTGLPSGNGSNPSAYRPNRGPSIKADANADDPPFTFRQIHQTKRTKIVTSHSKPHLKMALFTIHIDSTNI